MRASRTHNVTPSSRAFCLQHAVYTCMCLECMYALSHAHVSKYWIITSKTYVKVIFFRIKKGMNKPMHRKTYIHKVQQVYCISWVFNKLRRLNTLKRVLRMTFECFETRVSHDVWMLWNACFALFTLSAYRSRIHTSYDTTHTDIMWRVNFSCWCHTSNVGWNICSPSWAAAGWCSPCR